MDISKIGIGQNPPDDLNVIIEVPLGGEPIKYEIDKASGAIMSGSTIIPICPRRCATGSRISSNTIRTLSPTNG